jgi:hypothetical protein
LRPFWLKALLTIVLILGLSQALAHPQHKGFETCFRQVHKTWSQTPSFWWALQRNDCLNSEEKTWGSVTCWPTLRNWAGSVCQKVFPNPNYRSPELAGLLKEEIERAWAGDIHTVGFSLWRILVRGIALPDSVLLQSFTDANRFFLAEKVGGIELLAWERETIHRALSKRFSGHEISYGMKEPLVNFEDVLFWPASFELIEAPIWFLHESIHLLRSELPKRTELFTDEDWVMVTLVEEFRARYFEKRIRAALHSTSMKTFEVIWHNLILDLDFFSHDQKEAVEAEIQRLEELNINERASVLHEWLRR